ncbi:DNA helicase PIF1, ATP-dependent [Corchorus capsularis]|uniref:ATP-dependent DNA helicase n=1 Tax=Corchorus capsularis TaxID=210143 RepID=A0A1R3HEP0_COCAP|nr:DNA helicase PIF1, ATP-dependent [Corchorus capsularis]
MSIRPFRINSKQSDELVIDWTFLGLLQYFQHLRSSSRLLTTLLESHFLNAVVQICITDLAIEDFQPWFVLFTYLKPLMARVNRLMRVEINRQKRSKHCLHSFVRQELSGPQEIASPEQPVPANKQSFSVQGQTCQVLMSRGFLMSPACETKSEPLTINFPRPSCGDREKDIREQLSKNSKIEISVGCCNVEQSVSVCNLGSKPSDNAFMPYLDFSVLGVHTLELSSSTRDPRDLVLTASDISPDDLTPGLIPPPAEANGAPPIYVSNEHLLPEADSNASFTYTDVTDRNNGPIASTLDGNEVNVVAHSIGTGSIHKRRHFEPLYLGGANWICPFCGANMWYGERINLHRETENPVFTLFCRQGTIRLPPTRLTPQFLRELMDPAGPRRSRLFRENIRVYNSLFQFTSFGGKMDQEINQKPGPFTFSLNGLCYHRMGCILPGEGRMLVFAQLYIFDTDREIENRINALFGGQEAEKINRQNVEDLCQAYRDIIIEHRNEGPKKISTVHPFYMAFQYPLLFPYGEDGSLMWTLLSRRHLSDNQLQCVNFMLTSFNSELLSLIRSYGTTIYSISLLLMPSHPLIIYDRDHQTDFRCDMLDNVKDAVSRGDGNNVGKRIILPASYTGGPRYMFPNYQDAMAICSYFGYPSLFITFTCNPKLTEIQEALDQIPEEQSRWTTAVEIDEIISAKLPNFDGEPISYAVVSSCMMHGPCGTTCFNAPCMKEGRCSKFFPKQFNSSTVVGDSGFVNYRRMDSGIIAKKSGIELDNSQPLNDLLARPNVNKIMFTEWMETNRRLPEARTFLYADFPTKWVWLKSQKVWKPRKQRRTYGRIIAVHPTSGPLFYLWLLLNVVPGATNYDNLCMVNVILYPTFQAACYVCGLLGDDCEGNHALAEAAETANSGQLRLLMVMMLQRCQVVNPAELFEGNWRLLGDDIQYRFNRLWASSNFSIPDDDLRSYVLVELEKLLNSNVASSGIASLLLPGGRTAHSRFRFPIDINERSVCDIIKVNKSLSDILFDPQTDRSRRLFGGKTLLLGGDFRQIFPIIPHGCKTDIVSASISNSELWPFFEVFTLRTNMKLTHKGLNPVEKENLQQFANWLLDVGDGNVSSGSCPSEIDARIVTIPKPLLIRCRGDPIQAVFNCVYEDFQLNFMKTDYLKERAIVMPYKDTVDKINRYALNLIPSEMRTYFSCETLVRDFENLRNENLLHSPELLNSLVLPGFPDHQINLKVGCVVMLFRNVNQAAGLCNGTRLLITQLATNVVEGRILANSGIGEKIMSLKQVRLSQLRRGRMADYVILKVMQRGNTIFPTTKKFPSIDFLFADNEGNAIHGLMEPILDSEFENLLSEGGVYKIENFQVKCQKPTHNAVSFNHTILLTLSTVVNEFQGDVSAFPRNYFIFATMQDITDRKDSYRFMTDVVGMLVAITKPNKIKVRKQDEEVEKQTLHLKLLSGDEIKVSVWALFLNHVEFDSLVAQQPKPVLAVVGTTVKKVDEFLTLTITTGTKIYVDLDIPQDDHTPVFVLAEDKPLLSREEMYKDVSERHQKFRVNVVVKGIDTSMLWYYVTCGVCLQALLDGFDGFFCTQHQIQTPQFTNLDDAIKTNVPIMLDVLGLLPIPLGFLQGLDYQGNRRRDSNDLCLMILDDELNSHTETLQPFGNGSDRKRKGKA